jgi:DNA-binding transcriptional ArsR family regulator
LPRAPGRAIDPQAVDLARSAVLAGAAEREARKVLETLCEPTRLTILRALRKTPLAASDLAQVLGRTRSATSQHLRVLREADAVVAERAGNVIRYRFATSRAANVLAEICAAFDRLAA